MKCLHATVFTKSEMIRGKCSCLVSVSFIEEERNDQIALTFKNLLKNMLVDMCVLVFLQSSFPASHNHFNAFALPFILGLYS